MDKAFFDRWMPASGILFVVLLVVGLLVVGDFPTLDDPAEEFAAFYIDDRGRVIAGALIFAFALYVFVWFAAALAARVRDAGETRLAATILGGGLAFVAISLVATGILVATAHTAAEEADPTVIKSLDAVASGVDILSILPFAALVFAFGVAVLRTGLLAPWFGFASLVASLVFVLGATTWARDGFWAPYGGFFVIGFIVLLAWILVASGLLVSRPPEPRPGEITPPSRTPA
jgi:hypothetical protein